MGTAISIDGALVDPSTAAIPVMDRGFLYGDSAFEVLRTYEGRPFAVGPHLERLRWSCGRLQIPVPVDDETFRREIRAGLGAAGNAESYVRVIVTRGVTPIGLHLDHVLTARRVIVVLELSPPAGKELYEKGGELATVTIARALDGTGAAGVKASNYLANILSLAVAKERGAYEAISVASGGELLEGSTSNLFLVKDGVLLTPPLGLGILEGITRRVVLEAAADEGIEVQQRMLFPPDLYGADEAFITSSLREVVPMVGADGVVLGDGRPGPVTARLHAAFRRRASAMLADAAAG